MSAGAINPDRMIYFVLCSYGAAGIGWAERDIGRTNRKDTITDIRSGELPDVVQVIEVNFVEFSSRDVTEDIRAECIKANFIAIGERLFGEELAAARFDHARDHRKHEVPA